MRATQQISPPQSEILAGALERLWDRHLPEIKDRLALIESAAAAAAAGSLTRGQQQAAHAAAHKLAGVLGTFGLAEATAPAREIEHLYAQDAAPPPESAARLVGMAASLRALIESHMRPQPPAK
jgi:HPt (histidine-containing phosphotransfer) domain-containing protein